MKGLFNSTKETLNFELHCKAKFKKVALNIWQCIQCKETFQSETLMHLHARRQNCEVTKQGFKQPYLSTTCEDCSEKFENRKSLMKHRVKVHPEYYECCYCEKTFTRRSDWQRHKKKHTSQPFQCVKCNYSTHRNDSLSYHMRLHHPLVGHFKHLNLII